MRSCRERAAEAEAGARSWQEAALLSRQQRSAPTRLSATAACWWLTQNNAPEALSADLALLGCREGQVVADFPSDP